MEKKFYTDDFEQFLKDTTDDFRMYPSKRVWNSLYNNLHPGRKWPSLAVCLLLVSSIIFIGLSHRNEITGSANVAKKDVKNNPLIAQQNNNKITASNHVLATETSLENSQTQVLPSTSVGSVPVQVLNSQDKNSGRFVAVKTTITYKNNNSLSVKNDPDNADNSKDQNVGTNNKFIRSIRTFSAMQLTTAVAEDNNVIGTENKIARHRIEKNNTAVAIENNPHQPGIIEKVFPVVILPGLSIAKNNSINLEKEWVEDYAFHNQPIPSLKSRLQYQLYLTPSVGFRTLTQTAKYNAPARPSLVTTVPDGQNALQQNPGFNLEAGYSVIYAQSKSMHIKGGVQFNFTDYKIHAHQLGHSTYTNLVLKDSYSSTGAILSQRSTSLANLAGNGNDKKLNSSTFQVSLPLGADIKFAGKHNLQWFVGATVQPTYVLFGNAYLISADSRNYVYDSKFLRKWNLNAGIEAFVSYRTKKGITFNAGPQFRYQFFSTYDKKYSFDEKLYNVGIKLGVTKNF
ncbi:MAG: outer membrane beta-barrel protein [Ferruginibacter sp.]